MSQFEAQCSTVLMKAFYSIISLIVFVGLSSCEKRITTSNISSEETQSDNLGFPVEELKEHLEWSSHLIRACYVIGGKADEFQDFMLHQGIKTHSPGGSELHEIQVHRDDLKKFREVLSEPKIMDKYGIHLKEN